MRGLACGAGREEGQRPRGDPGCQRRGGVRRRREENAAGWCCAYPGRHLHLSDPALNAAGFGMGKQRARQTQPQSKWGTGTRTPHDSSDLSRRLGALSAPEYVTSLKIDGFGYQKAVLAALRGASAREVLRKGLTTAGASASDCQRASGRLVEQRACRHAVRSTGPKGALGAPSDAQAPELLHMCETYKWHRSNTTLDPSHHKDTGREFRAQRSAQAERRA